MKKLLPLCLAVSMATLMLAPATALGSTPAATGGGWFQYRGDARRSGFQKHETRITPATVGSLHLTKPLIAFPFDGPTPPLVYGHTIYTIATTFEDPDTPEDQTTVYAINAPTGKILWTDRFECREQISVPAISIAAQMLIVPLRAGCGSQTGSGSFLGLDLATGKIKWGGGSATAPGSPAVLGSTGYVRMLDAGGSDIVAFNTATGDTDWNVEGDFPFSSNDTAVGGGAVYIREDMSGDPMLTAIDAATGDRLWTKGSATGSPTFGGGRIYVACDAGICSYDKNGQLKWSAPGKGGVAFAHGTVYASCHVTDLCALDGKTGSLLWRMTPSPSLPHPPLQKVTSVSVAGGVVYAGLTWGSKIGWVETVDAESGDDLGEFGPRANDPIISNGKVYLVSENRIYVYRLL